nr:hypothetical protein [Tanacetum cinerariifolium]
MTSFGYRLNPRYAIEECSSSGALYTRDCSCSKGGVEDKILVPKPPKNYARCGHPVNGPYCQGCTLLREKLEEDLVTYFQKFQNTSESSDGSTNVVNAPREPFCQSMSQNFYNSNSLGFDQTQPSQFPVIYPPPKETSIEISHDQENDRVSKIKDAFENKQYKPEDIQELFRKLLDDLQNIHEELVEFINSPSWNRPAVYDDDDDDVDYNIAITPILSTEELDNSLTLKDDPTSSFEFLTKSSSTSPTPFLEGTNTFHNSLPEFENFCFNLEETSNDSTTTQSDISLPEYDSFIFDLSNDQFPPTDRSDFTHEEFGDELTSPPKYDCFYFGNLPNSGELASSLNSGICENLSSTTCVNLPFEDDYSPLLAYVVWIFVAYLTYPIIPPHLYSFRNEDTIFDPGITLNRTYSFKPGLSHRCGTFKKFNTNRSHLNESPMEMLFSTLFPMDQ